MVKTLLNKFTYFIYNKVRMQKKVMAGKAADENSYDEENL